MAVITVNRYNPPNIIACQITADPTQAGDVMTVISAAGAQAGYKSIITCTPDITDGGPPYGLVWTVTLTKSGVQSQAGVEFDWIVFDAFDSEAIIYSDTDFNNDFVPTGEQRSTATPSMTNVGTLRTVIAAAPSSIDLTGVGDMTCVAGKEP